MAWEAESRPGEISLRKNRSKRNNDVDNKDKGTPSRVAVTHN